MEKSTDNFENKKDIVPPPPLPRRVIRREGLKAIHTNQREVIYKDVKWKGSSVEYLEKVQNSTTVYIGNVSYQTKEEEVFALFSKCGTIKSVIMGLDRYKKTPCGFCFVIYETASNAHDAVRYLNEAKLNENNIRVDKDQGFFEGRQYGRGRKGGQMRDDYQMKRNRGRGGGRGGRYNQQHRGRNQRWRGRGGGRRNYNQGGQPFRNQHHPSLVIPRFQPDGPPPSLRHQPNRTLVIPKPGEINNTQKQLLVKRPPPHHSNFQNERITGKKRKRDLKDREDVEIEEWEKRKRKRRKRLEDSSSSGSESEEEEEEEFKKKKKRDDSDDEDDDIV